MSHGVGQEEQEGRRAHEPVDRAGRSAVADAAAAAGGPVELADLDTGGTGFGPQSKADAAEAMLTSAPRLAELQERLFAQGQRAGDRRSLLLILQGMDTAGKDGVIKHVVGLVDPAGVQLASFKSPTAEELAHDFLWRIQQAGAGGRA